MKKVTKKVVKKLQSYSKKICTFSLVMLTLSIVVGVIFSIFGIALDLFPYIIPTLGGLATISVGFYYNKAKAENLSKQKLRTVIIKNTLEGKIDDEEYQEICQELEEIDMTVDAKLDEMFNNSVQEDVEIPSTNL